MKPELLLLLVLALPARAANLVVPAAAPLLVTNAAEEPVPVTITFYGPDGRTVETRMLTGTATLDVPAGASLIRISSGKAGASLTAHAANLPAIPIDALATEHILGGSIVVANPWNVPASLVVTLGDRQLFRVVPPLDVLRIDAADSSARITSQVGVYAYDEHAFGGAVVPAPTTVEPRCAEPAPLATSGERGEGWLVILNPETPLESLQAELPARHGTMPLQFYSELPGFLAELTPAQLAELRCEAAVQLIQQTAH